MSLTDREKLLVSMIASEGWPCPYFTGMPIEGEYGRKTCNKGCWEEPGCDGYPSFDMNEKYPDLLEAVCVAIAQHLIDGRAEVHGDPAHPLHDWLAKRDADYAKDLAEWRADSALSPAEWSERLKETHDEPE